MTASNFLKWVEALRHFSCLSIQVTKNSQPSIPRKGEVSQISTSRVCRNGSTPTFTVIDPETFWALKHATCNTFDEKQNDIVQENAFCGRSFIMACELVPCRHNILHVSQLNFKISFPMSSIYYSFLSCNAFHAFLSKEFSLVAEKLFPAVRSHTTTIPYCTCHRYRAAAARTGAGVGCEISPHGGPLLGAQQWTIRSYTWNRICGDSWESRWISDLCMNSTLLVLLRKCHRKPAHWFITRLQPHVCVRSQHLPFARSFVSRWHRKPCTFRGLVVHHQVVWRIFTTGIKWSATWNIYIWAMNAPPPQQ